MKRQSLNRKNNKVANLREEIILEVEMTSGAMLVLHLNHIFFPLCGCFVLHDCLPRISFLVYATFCFLMSEEKVCGSATRVVLLQNWGVEVEAFYLTWETLQQNV